MDDNKFDEFSWNSLFKFLKKDAEIVEESDKKEPDIKTIMVKCPGCGKTIKIRVKV